MGFDDDCSTGLVLGLGFSSSCSDQVDVHKSAAAARKPAAAAGKVASVSFEPPSLTLSLSGETFDHQVVKKVPAVAANKVSVDQSADLYRQDSAASSYSNASVKRERESEEAEMERVSSRVISDEDDDGGNGRKKLRLTKAQSALLEESFKQHSTLNPVLHRTYIPSIVSISV